MYQTVLAEDLKRKVDPIHTLIVSFQGDNRFQDAIDNQIAVFPQNIVHEGQHKGFSFRLR